MDTTVRATCPKCRTSLRIPAQWVGQAVKCKKCGAIVRSKPKNDDDTPRPVSNGTAVAAPLDQTVPTNAFDFVKPAAEDDPFPLPEPIAPTEADNGPLGNFGSAPAPAPQPQPPQAQPQPGYPYPMPPGYAPPPGYPYAPPGYPYPAPPGYPPGAYAPPPGYPYPMPPGYAPPPGAYAPPGYPYAPPAPSAPGMPPAAPMPAPLPGPVKPGVPAKPQGQFPMPAAPRTPDPIPPSNEFKTDASAPIVTSRRYRRSSGKGKLIWVAVCLLLAGGLVAGGIYAAKFANEKYGKKDQANGGGDDGKTDNTGGPGAGGGTPGATKGGPFPRRLLFIHISRYMYLNPLTASQPGGPDRSKSFADRLVFDWRIPTDKENNQLFMLSDTTRDPILPMKSVLKTAYEKFFETSRKQDRIVVYFGGHALEKEGKAYLAPIEGDLDDASTLIPLDEFYAKMSACPATQKVVIWDVCRLNQERGKQRPGSEPMSESLAKSLANAPAGIEVITSCQAKENALEFSSLTPPESSARTCAGSAFLESAQICRREE